MTFVDDFFLNRYLLQSICISKNAYRFQSHLAQDAPIYSDYDEQQGNPSCDGCTPGAGTRRGCNLPHALSEAVHGSGIRLRGKLIFPSMQDAASILEGSSKLTLTIVNVDAESRVFEWDSNKPGFITGGLHD